MTKRTIFAFTLAALAASPALATDRRPTPTATAAPGTQMSMTARPQQAGYRTQMARLDALQQAAAAANDTAALNEIAEMRAKLAQLAQQQQQQQQQQQPSPVATSAPRHNVSQPPAVQPRTSHRGGSTHGNAEPARYPALFSKSGTPSRGHATQPMHRQAPSQPHASSPANASPSFAGLTEEEAKLLLPSIDRSTKRRAYVVHARPALKTETDNRSIDAPTVRRSVDQPISYDFGEDFQGPAWGNEETGRRRTTPKPIPAPGSAAWIMMNMKAANAELANHDHGQSNIQAELDRLRRELALD